MKPSPEFTVKEWRLIAVALVSSKAPGIIAQRDNAKRMALKIASYTGQFDAEGKPK